MKGINIPQELWGQIDFNNWQIANVNEMTSDKLCNTYVARRYKMYVISKAVDEELLAAFQEDFERWTMFQWSNTGTEFKRLLRTLLRQGGIYTGNLLRGRASS